MKDIVEQIETRIEREVDKIDEHGRYPCYYCGIRYDIHMMYPISEHPDAPGMCYDCAEIEFHRTQQKRQVKGGK